MAACDASAPAALVMREKEPSVTSLGARKVQPTWNIMDMMQFIQQNGWDNANVNQLGMGYNGRILLLKGGAPKFVL